jgi:hypothetical protein
MARTKRTHSERSPAEVEAMKQRAAQAQVARVAWWKAKVRKAYDPFARVGEILARHGFVLPDDDLHTHFETYPHVESLPRTPGNFENDVRLVLLCVPQFAKEDGAGGAPGLSSDAADAAEAVRTMVRGGYDEDDDDDKEDDDGGDEEDEGEDSGSGGRSAGWWVLQFKAREVLSTLRTELLRALLGLQKVADSAVYATYFDELVRSHRERMDGARGPSAKAQGPLTQPQGAGAEVRSGGTEAQGASADMHGAGAEVQGASADVHGAGAEVQSGGAQDQGLPDQGKVLMRTEPVDDAAAASEHGEVAGDDGRKGFSEGGVRKRGRLTP